MISSVIFPPVVPQTQQSLCSSNPPSGLPGGLRSAVGDSPAADPDREAPRDERQPGCTAGVCEYLKVPFRVFSNRLLINCLLCISTSPPPSPRCLPAGP